MLNIIPGFAQIKEDWNYSVKTGLKLFSNVQNWDNKELYTLTTIVAVTTTAYYMDNSIRENVQKNKTEFLDNALSLDKYSVETGIALAGGTYIVGLASDDPKLRKIGVDLTQAIVYTGVITEITKAVVGRERPHVSGTKDIFKSFNYKEEYVSFPSGHTSTAFAVATVMANNSNNTIVKILWFTAASMVGLARIYHDMHWSSDVITGALIGYYVGDFVSSSREEDNKINKPSLSITPISINLKIPL